MSQSLDQHNERALRFAQGEEPAVAGRVIFVPVNLLDPNPEQYRKDTDASDIEDLAGNIEQHGLHVPICVVNTDNGRYQVVYGHRRMEAFKLLLKRATNDEERDKWKAIKAIEDPTATTAKLKRTKAINENLQRADPHDVDTGLALLKHVTEENWTTEQIATYYSIPVVQVRRYLTVARAPSFIQDAIAHGLMMPVLNDDGTTQTTPQGRPRQIHTPKLDKTAGLEIIKLYQSWAKPDLSKKFDDPKAADAAAQKASDKAQKRVTALLERALTQSWGFRKIQTYVNAAIHGLDGTDTATPARPTAKIQPQPWKDSDKQLVIHKDRLAEITEEQREALQKLLTGLLEALKPRDQR
jgi:ParB/RepB/Spo0J family partition protein